MADRTQLYRDVAIGTAMGDDVLLFQSMHFSEQLGRPFQAELDLYSEQDTEIDFAKIIGTNITVRLEQGDGDTRFFNGYVSRFVQASRTGRMARYHATMVPWIWFLTRTSDCRIFQFKSIPDIVQFILKEKGYSDVELNLTGTHTPKDYCVQYRETDFNFISRLMERDGIYYFFKHENGKHTLVLCDSPAAHKAYPKYDEITYRATAGDTNREYISDWTVEQSVQPGVYALNDFDFTVPKKALLTRAQGEMKYPGSDYEIYDYPGEYVKQSDGQDYSKIRIEELQAQHEVISASSDAMGIAAGFTFTLAEPPRKDQAQEHLITSATIQISSDQFDSGGGNGTGGGGGPMFSAHFTAIKSKTHFRPARITPKPIVQGPQTAIVVGKSGEEIWTDEYGRVKVQFHWDRHNLADENSSCWMRVSHIWAGKKWGSVHIPRVGMEVIVQFLEGDPDLPIITGCVYNGDNKPPYALPDHATMSTTKSYSSKGGGGFNELRFEDKKGSEKIFIHAEHNHHLRVKNSERESVGANRHLVVGKDQFEKVSGDKHLHVVGDHNEKLDGNMSLQVGQNLQEKVGMNHGFEAGMEIHLKAGMNVVIEAGVSLTLKAGASFIQIDASGVAISGAPLLLLNSGGAAGSGQGANPTSPQDARAADDADPGVKMPPPDAPPPVKPFTYSASAKVLKMAAVDGTPFCEKCATAAADSSASSASEGSQA